MPPEFSSEHLCVSKTKIYSKLGADAEHLGAAAWANT